MTVESDPRVYFAAERTLLAWVRTGVAVVGLGFVVARFGLFMRLVSPHHPDAPSSAVSSLVGGALVLIASTFTGIAAVQFGRMLARLAPHEKPPNTTGTLALLLALALAAGGVVLGLFLL